MTALTSKQERVLEFIRAYIAEHRCGPFIREIQDACQIVSYKSVIDRLNALERQGFIKRTPNKHRAIRVMPKIHELRPKAAVAQSAPEPVADEASTTLEPIG